MPNLILYYNSFQPLLFVVYTFLTFSFWVFGPLPLFLWSDPPYLHLPSQFGHLQDLKHDTTMSLHYKCWACHKEDQP